MLIQILLLFSFVAIACVLCNKLTNRVGIPMLLAFLGVGMLCGTDGLLGISFENDAICEQVSTVALIFIIFYGGFGTKWSEAKPVAGRSVLLSTVGVFLTAGLVGGFCHFVLHMQWLEALLTGSVLSSTDAASVFSILRSKRLNLKDGTASLLEVESGSNDPVAFLMTTVILTMMTDGMSVGTVLYLIFAQIAYSIFIGVGLAWLTVQFLKRFHFETSGFDMIFLLAVAVLSYALPVLIGGNGYLSAYIAGIILGNARIPNKKKQVPFFDGVTGLMQMLLFFILGLFATPSRLPSVLLPALVIAGFLTILARPIVVGVLLTPFRARLRQQLLVSWSGLRGATSAVFAVTALASGVALEQDLFHTVFCVVLLSIAIQGTLLPACAKKLDMIDEDGDVLKTFTDYTEEQELQLIQFPIASGSAWAGKAVRELILPPETLLVMLIRGTETMIPKGDTMVQDGDTAVLSASAYRDDQRIQLCELEIQPTHAWCGREIRELTLPSEELIILIRRGTQSLIPQGNLKIQSGDVLVMNAAE